MVLFGNALNTFSRDVTWSLRDVHDGAFSYIIDTSVKSLDHLIDNRNWPFKIANKVIVNVFS